ncbi:hypothetical protein C8F04DRAFT_975459 [Mycena alexandri]|uniref:DUF6570 domain-containing protein n=1 Tax=Mycena alexandri TaxID=1745969 RepID=A0AAD6WNV0_9AGAR|nr:hypothetical protein C8F04DRAFT_975459 [Mycena alexandri]
MAKKAEKRSHKRKNKINEPSTASERRKARLLAIEKARIRDIARSSEPDFPPKPPSKKLLCKIARGFCEEMDPAVFEEAGCAVCGQLTTLRELTPLASIPYSLDLLEREGVTCTERFSETDEVDELNGPVLDLTCNSVFVDREIHLINGVSPPLALANGFWIGTVPEVLKGLSFAEKMLIARIRHNRCLVRIYMKFAEAITVPTHNPA